MKLQVLAHNTHLNPLMRELVQRRIGFALGRFSHRILRVVVRFEDVNGPRGGADQRCRIKVTLITSGEVTTHATEIDAETALQRASARIARRVRNECDRRRTRRRRTRPQVSEPVAV